MDGCPMMVQHMALVCPQVKALPIESMNSVEFFCFTVVMTFFTDVWSGLGLVS